MRCCAFSEPTDNHALVLGMPRSSVVVVAGDLVDLGEFGGGSGEADLEAFDFAEPAFTFGLGDTGGEVVPDVGQAGGSRPARGGHRSSSGRSDPRPPIGGGAPRAVSFWVCGRVCVVKRRGGCGSRADTAVPVIVAGA